eukprot:scaffold134928_cov19-Tisochrysis_lutea.AAC.1
MVRCHRGRHHAGGVTEWGRHHARDMLRTSFGWPSRSCACHVDARLQNGTEELLSKKALGAEAESSRLVQLLGAVVQGTQTPTFR